MEAAIQTARGLIVCLRGRFGLDQNCGLYRIIAGFSDYGDWDGLGRFLCRCGLCLLAGLIRDSAAWVRGLVGGVVAGSLAKVIRRAGQAERTKRGRVDRRQK